MKTRKNLNVERLETREVMASSLTATQVGGILTVEGTPNADKIYIEQSPGTNKIYVGNTVNGSETNRNGFAGVTEIRVYGLGQNDMITGDYYNSVTRATNTVRVKMIISGGDGADSLTGGSANDHLDGGNGNDLIIGGEGADLIAGQVGVDSLYGRGGNDVIYGGAGGSSPEEGGADTDYIYGEGGNDAIWGGGGADYLYGGADTDVIYGGTGKDVLYGEFSSTPSSSTSANNWLEPGSPTDANVKAEFTANGWNPYRPSQNGMTFGDVDQENSNSCLFLSSLAATAKTGRINDTHIQYLGSQNFRVKFFAPTTHQSTWVDMKFDGSMVRLNGSLLDPASNNYEFWTVIYQRAYYKRFFGFDYATNPQSMANYTGTGPDSNFAMSTLMPYSFAVIERSSSSFTANQIKTILGQNWGVTTTLKLWGRETANAPLTSSNHSYMLSRVWTRTDGTTMIELYNPWHSSRLNFDGLDSNGRTITTTPGASAGLVSITWADYQKLATYYAW